MALSNISFDTCTSGITIKKKDINATVKKLKTVNDFPTFSQPKIATGIFNNRTSSPVEIEIFIESRSMSEPNCATPFNPAAYTCAGIKKKFIPIAFKSAAIIAMAVFLAYSLYTIFELIFFSPFLVLT
ncbi:conserved hypothetical protein [Listeria ivanovii FSL F6-596]|nr:conserved hypothetical protein [Listeria ivanovii FSL F6-596]